MEKKSTRLFLVWPVLAVLFASCGTPAVEDAGDGAGGNEAVVAIAADGGSKGDKGGGDLISAPEQDPKPCMRNSDCAGGEVCREYYAGSFCLPECREDRDCLEQGEGYVCVDLVCKKGSDICLDGGKETCGIAKGLCSPGTRVCANGKWGECAGEVTPATEVCDAVDNDCDGDTDENIVGGQSAGDSCEGKGVCPDGVLECDGPSGLKCSTMPGGSAYVGTLEICDGADNDCDGAVDEEIDGIHAAGDPCIGQGVCGIGTYECASNSFTQIVCSTMLGGSAYVGNLERCDDELDNDCDGAVNEDCLCVHEQGATLANQKLCGSSNKGACHYGTQECQPSGTWGACVDNTEPESEICDGVDNDCNGKIDDGYKIGDSCTMPGICGAGVVECVMGTTQTRCSTEAGASNNKSTAEICDTLDNDCDGVADEDYFVGAFCQGKGICSTGEIECASIVTTRCSTDPKGSDDASSAEVCDTLDNDCDAVVDNGVKNACGYCGVVPVDGPPNACDTIDNDCDGLVDEGCVCEDGKTQPCGSVQAGVGICIAGIQVCDAGMWSATCFGVTNPATEVFDMTPAKDEDCDGAVNEGGVCATGDHRACGLTLGVCKPGVEACGAAGQWDGICVGVVVGGFDGPPGSCDGLDNDCDGTVDENCGGCVSGVVLACGSNTGICKQGTQTCIGGLWDATCVNSAPPLTIELCNGLDDNCDGNVPANESDADGDGVRPCGVPTDCNNANDAIRPGATELCDGVDNNCSGQPDENYFVGAPCNGVGACAVTPGIIECASLVAMRCSTGPGGSAYAGSADGPLGACDGVDNDCDGVVDETCGGCVSGNTRVCGTNTGICKQGTQTCINGSWDAVCVGSTAPLVAELCNGLDDNCDGATPLNELDSDGDGVRVCAGDCNDANTSIRPGAGESCDGVDNDCDGLIDEAPYYVGAPCEGEGVCSTGVIECATTSSTRCSTNPGGSAYGGGTEVCDTLDNDCDGQIDEGVKNACGYCGAVPADGTPNACDGVDNDCDGQTDETCACNDGAQLACGPPQAGVGICVAGIQVCNNGAWGACQNAVNPAAEICNGLDDNCNGQVDEGLTCPAVFTWTPPTAINSDFELTGCFGTSIDAQGRVVCLGWDMICIKQNVSSLTCNMEIPPGYYVQYNARRVGDSYWMVDNAAQQGTHSLVRNGTSASGCVVLSFSANDESLRCILP
ncbi:MAG: putative metal-binding motif-containing protein [Patescibacteria group bacterium]